MGARPVRPGQSLRRARFARRPCGRSRKLAVLLRQRGAMRPTSAKEASGSPEKQRRRHCGVDIDGQEAFKQFYDNEGVRDRISETSLSIEAGFLPWNKASSTHRIDESRVPGPFLLKEAGIAVCDWRHGVHLYTMNIHASAGASGPTSKSSDPDEPDIGMISATETIPLPYLRIWLWGRLRIIDLIQAGIWTRHARPNRSDLASCVHENERPTSHDEPYALPPAAIWSTDDHRC